MAGWEGERAHGDVFMYENKRSAHVKNKERKIRKDVLECICNVYCLCACACERDKLERCEIIGTSVFFDMCNVYNMK